jgi:pyruvate,orthophosphate dikinase
VLFTRNPATGEPAVYGDVLFEAQGEDVVAGTHQPEPIAVLDERLPSVARALHEAADRLERHYRDLCDIEFTIEEGRLWLLQVRVGKRSRQAALRIATDMANDPAFPLSRREAVERVLPILADPPTTAVVRDPSVQPILSGLPASPGVASGPIVTSPEAAQASAEHDRPAILVRAETSPDDIHGMAVAAGILTSRGGLASHAAVVARGWGIPAVVGAERLEVGEGEIRLDGRALRTGELLTIDGGTGEVFEGEVAGSSEVVPEALTLLEWARAEGLEIDRAEPATTNLPAVRSTGPVDAERILRTVAIKGFALPDAVADAVLASPNEVHPIVDRLVADGLVDSTAGTYKLTDAGRARADQHLVAERNAWGLEAATAALDAFLDIDDRVKGTVTAWQLRDEKTPNDHTDAKYDASVLDRLAGIHADTTAWLATRAAGCPRLADYGARLRRALDAARAGDGRFVASPRVDSYHGIWFELHEDLIRLAGRTREEESAAGRA